MLILKNYNNSIDESQFLESLSEKEDFINPFILSCASRNAKFSAIALQSLHKLIQFKSIPVSKLNSLVDSFIEATHLAVDIQLRVLQILPTFFQSYNQFINGELVAKILLVCSILQSYNKTPMVINTAGATEQQIMLSLFEKVLEEDKLNDIELNFEVQIDDDKLIKISSNAFDCFRIFNDFCSLIEHQKPTFLKFNSISESLGFELLETVLTNYKDLFLTHEEFAFLVRTKITPLLLRSFSNHKDFSIVVRVSRIIFLLIKSQLSILEIETEVILSLLTHVLTKDSNLPNWKKILSLEIFNNIFKDFKLIKLIFKTYDYDFDNNKKKIIQEFLTVISNLIKEPIFEKILNPQEIIKNPDQNERVINLQNSLIKIPYLDSLDKLEPPQSPDTYQIYLILNIINSFGEGLGKFVLNKSKIQDNNLKTTFVFLSELSEDEQNNLDFLILKSILVSTAESIVNIGNEFLYSCLSNELFHSLIRSLQKLCHSSGILGLNRQRDSLLLLFSIATVSNVSKKPIPQIRHNSIGDFLVDQFTSSSEQLPVIDKFHTRYLNSRHVICFRALTSLTISLGPILSKSWKFILITFQWFDYYLNGPSNYLPIKDIPPKPELSIADLKSVENSLHKLNESTKNFNDESFDELINQLIKLSNITIFENIEVDDPLYNNELNICPYNKEFFLNKLNEFSISNSERFLVENNQYDFWLILNNFLINNLSSKKIKFKEEEIKKQVSLNFNLFIKEISKIGFNNTDSTLTSNLEVKLFNSLSNLIKNLLNKEDINSIDLEIIYSILNTLYDLLNQFGNHFNNSWLIILRIINSPFIFLKNNNTNLNTSKNLLKSSFEILQLILNDFLESIKPLNSTKSIIDVLNQFVSQNIDLNISFSAVSYYWLLSDFYRQKFLELEIKQELIVENFNELNDLLMNQKSDNIKALWLYLLNSLVKISNDDRIEISNVAIQTFFRIVDSHGSYLNWYKTFNIVVRDLLSIKFKKPDENDFELLKSFNDYILVTLKGINNLYSLYFINYSDEVFWNSLLDFYESLIDLNIIEITKNVFISFNEILNLFKNEIPLNLFEIFFKFWSIQQIKYVSLTDSDNYQISLIELIKNFEILYNNENINLSRSQIESSLLIFNNAIRFPFLPSFTSDIKKPTELQANVLNCFEIIKINDEIEDLILMQLSNLIQLPFLIRSRILKKLSNSNKKQIPSFIATSIKSISILKNQLLNLNNTNFSKLIENGVLIKIINNLLDPIKYHLNNNKIDNDDPEHFKNISNQEIWKETLNLIVSIIPKILPILDDFNEDISSELWSLIIESITLTLPHLNEDRDFEFNLKIYETLKNLILINISKKSLNSNNIELLISSIWKSSFLYENNLIENYLLENNSSPLALTKQLLSLDIESYSTEPIKLLSQQSFRLTCLSDLFKFSDINYGNFESSELLKLVNITLPFLLCRIVLIIRRYSDQQRLVNNLPVYTVQKKELKVVLENLYELLKNLTTDDLKTYEQLFSIFPFILDNQQYLKLKDTEHYLTGITVEFYKLTS